MRLPTLALPLLLNYLASAWTALIGIAVLPIYIRHLGLEAFALVGLYVTALALVILLDFGLSTMANRRLGSGADGVDAAGLLRGAEILSWAVTVIGCALTAAVLPPLAGLWLRPVTLPADEVRQALLLLGPAAITSVPGLLYTGALYGRGRHGVVNAILVVAATARWVGAVGVTGPLHGGIIGFLAWQIVVNLLSSLVFALAAWQAVGGFTRWPGWAALRAERRFLGGVGLITTTGLLLSQLDKLVLPRVLPLDQFGAYTLAAMVAAVPARFSAPMFLVLLPRLSGLIEQGKAVAGVVTRSTLLLAALSFATAAGLTWLGEPLLAWWSGDDWATALAMSVLPALAFGSALNAVAMIPSAILLAAGRTQLILVVNLVWVVIQPVALILLAGHYGPVAAGWVWLALNASYLLVLGPAALTGSGQGYGRWLGLAVIWPAVAAIPAAWGAAHWLPLTARDWTLLPWLMVGGLMCVLAAGGAAISVLRIARR